jgi:anti-anti-sigma regulatory factor
MDITTRTSGTVAVVKLSGLLTAEDGATELGGTLRALIENGHTQIVLNCDAFMQDAVMSEIVRAYTAVQRRGGAIKVTLGKKIGAPGLLRTTQFLTVFETYDDEAQAIASFGGDKA